MEQMHWWKEDKFWYRGEACRNENDRPLFLEMIHEATRLGIQQGKREAFAVNPTLLDVFVTSWLRDTYDLGDDDNLSAAEVEEMAQMMARDLLSSLSNSSKDKV